MPAKEDFPAIFDKLKKILQKHEARLTVTQDTPEGYYLNARFSEEYKRVVFFGAVQLQKNYVSYYLMPVYMYPDLLKDISPALKKHMQGKSCFNFKAMDKALFNELGRLTRKGVARFKREKLI